MTDRRKKAIAAAIFSVSLGAISNTSIADATKKCAKETQKCDIPCIKFTREFSESEVAIYKKFSSMRKSYKKMTKREYEGFPRPDGAKRCLADEAKCRKLLTYKQCAKNHL